MTRKTITEYWEEKKRQIAAREAMKVAIWRFCEDIPIAEAKEILTTELNNVQRFLDDLMEMEARR